MTSCTRLTWFRLTTPLDKNKGIIWQKDGRVVGSGKEDHCREVKRKPVHWIKSGCSHSESESGSGVCWYFFPHTRNTTSIILHFTFESRPPPEKPLLYRTLTKIPSSFVSIVYLYGFKDHSSKLVDPRWDRLKKSIYSIIKKKNAHYYKLNLQSVHSGPRKDQSYQFILEVFPLPKGQLPLTFRHHPKWHSVPSEVTFTDHFSPWTPWLLTPIVSDRIGGEV